MIQFITLHTKDAGVEVVVVDGKSTDDTVKQARQAGAKVYVSETQSRAAQMNLGAKMSSGRVLYFVHADVALPATFVEDIVRALADGFHAGCYRYVFSSTRVILRINSFCTRFNSLLCRGGDQTLFVKREVFEQLNGFDEYYTIMEDYDFIKRLRVKFHFGIIPKNVLVSARKYDTNSWLRVQLVNLTVFILFFLGASPVKMKWVYRKFLAYRTDMGFLISGIQQVGIGVRDADQAWKWYRQNFGMDVPVFKDRATASLMTRYTGNKSHDRYAILALNLKGGGGLEIWQYTSRQPQPPSSKPVLGDLGIFAVKLKVSDIARAHEHLSALPREQVSAIQKGPDGRQHFFVKDPDGNLFQLIEHKSWFQENGFPIGGVCGCIIGVNNMDESIRFYQRILGHNNLLSDSANVAADFAGLPGGDRFVRRVLLERTDVGRGAFGQLLGGTEVELVEVREKPVHKIYQDRYWGDLGFIHVCFDVSGMNQLADHCDQMGHPFTVDSRNSFDMGKAAGHFSYTEDNDGTLIEFVETHKVPIMAKLGWYLDLRKRKMGKPLPKWVVKMMGLNRVKD